MNSAFVFLVFLQDYYFGVLEKCVYINDNDFVLLKFKVYFFLLKLMTGRKWIEFFLSESKNNKFTSLIIDVIQFWMCREFHANCCTLWVKLVFFEYFTHSHFVGSNKKKMPNYFAAHEPALNNFFIYRIWGCTLVVHTHAVVRFAQILLKKFSTKM